MLEKHFLRCSTKEDDDQDADSFHFLEPEEEPVLTPDFERRAVRSIAAAVYRDHSPSSSYKTPSLKCKNKCEKCCTFDVCAIKKLHVHTPTLSPEAQAAGKEGLTMMKKLFYPGMPKILQDIWVLTELALTILQFVLVITSISVASAEVFDILLLTLISVGLLLALVDSFIHFVQLGSCAATINYCRKKHKKNIKKKETPNKNRPKICRISPKRKQQIAEVLDFIRSGITDIMLYPLVLFDLNDLITSKSYLVQSSDDRVNLSLFMIGIIFLILSVYLSRFIMIISAAINFRRVSAFSSSNIYNMALWFLLYIFAQTLLHASILVSIGINIHLESNELSPFTAAANSLNIVISHPATPIPSSWTTQIPDQDLNGSVAWQVLNNTFQNVSSPSFYFPNTLNIFPFISSGFDHSSFYLVASGVAGLLVTQLGIVAFFFSNYYQIRELSVSFWVDMISLLQSESFTGLVFDGGITNAKKQAKEVVKNVNLTKVKDNLKTMQTTSTTSKFLYPIRVPIFIVVGVLYFSLLVVFLTFLSVVCVPVSSGNDPVCLSHFEVPSVYSIPYFVTFSLVIFANLQVIILVCILLLVLLAIVVFFVLAFIVFLFFIIAWCFL